MFPMYVKDHFGLSDKSYHELARVCEQLPHLNQVKKLANHLNFEWELKPVQETAAYNSLKSRLTTRVKQLLQERKICDGEKL